MRVFVQAEREGRGRPYLYGCAQKADFPCCACKSGQQLITIVMFDLTANRIAEHRVVLA